ncbi:hypothetical protein N1851_020394 [Merluccius polli]|uniref:Uncharacterized protein n=1 Tax=Merluccius polli TaxID=89951 RepID=A0AA47MKC1_MERPO|nr:hypothetical protein N1851_020394 [Merluccius polli]
MLESHGCHACIASLLATNGHDECPTCLGVAHLRERLSDNQCMNCKSIDARCPRPQCRITDDFLVKCYDTAARMGRIGNSWSHLILALSQSLQSSSVDASVHSLSDGSLQVFALMTRELGRLMYDWPSPHFRSQTEGPSRALGSCLAQHRSRPWSRESRRPRLISSLLAFRDLFPY